MSSESDLDEEFKVIGKSTKRTEGLQFVNGKAEYVHDIEDQRMLYGAFLRSPYPHAEIVEIDTSAAEAMDGVAAVLTGDDVRERTNAKGHFVQGKSRGDEYGLAVDRVRYVGDPVAVVAAENKYTAKDATDAIDVEYDRLDHVLEPEEALDDDAPVIHPEMEDVEGHDGNQSDYHEVTVGDVEQGFEEAVCVVEDEFSAGHFSGAPLETPGAVAEWNGSSEKLEIWDSTQVPHKIKSVLAAVLGLKASKVRVHKPEVGGGFGNKLAVYHYQICASLLAMDTDRPVKIVLDRDEHLGATRSCLHYRVTGKLGVDEDGNFTTIKLSILQDEGAYHSWGNGVMGLVMSGPSDLPYKFDNLSFDGQVVYTNRVPKGPIRGTGIRQLSFVRERLIDQAAEEMGVDPLKLRERNFITNDECPYKTPSGSWVDTSGIQEATDAVKDAYADALAEAADDPNKGIGVASMMEWTSCRHGHFDTDYESVVARMEEDGSVRLQSSSADMGTGTRTTLAQVVSERLGVEMDAINVIEGDTDATPPGLGSWGSRTMGVTGTAAYEAVEEIRERILDIASYNMEISEEDLELTEGRVQVKGNPNQHMTLSDIAFLSYNKKSKLPDGMTTEALLGKASFDTGREELETPTAAPDEDGKANMSMTYSSSTQVVLAEVDPDTGEVEICRYVVGDDVGKAVNPGIVEGQIEGGVGQGISVVLGEELVYDEGGQLLTDNFSSYQIRTAADMPPNDALEDHIVEVPSKNTAGGWKGAGEVGFSPCLGAISNAVSDAIGAEMNDLPITPQKVFEAMQEQDKPAD